MESGESELVRLNTFMKPGPDHNQIILLLRLVVSGLKIRISLSVSGGQKSINPVGRGQTGLRENHPNQTQPTLTLAHLLCRNLICLSVCVCACVHPCVCTPLSKCLDSVSGSSHLCVYVGVSIHVRDSNRERERDGEGGRERER